MPARRRNGYSVLLDRYAAASNSQDRRAVIENLLAYADASQRHEEHRGNPLRAAHWFRVWQSWDTEMHAELDTPD